MTLKECCPVCQIGAAPLAKAYSQKNGKWEPWLLGHIRSRFEFVEVWTGKAPSRDLVDLRRFEERNAELLERVAAVAAEKYAGFHDHSSGEGLERTMREYHGFSARQRERIDLFMAPFRASLQSAYAKLGDVIDALQAKAFSEKKEIENAPAPQATGKTKREEKKMAKTRIFREGSWEEVEMDGEDLAEQIKDYMSEHPGVPYLDAAVLVQKKMIGADPAKRFSETSEAAGVPDEATERLKSAKRGVAVKISDGREFMKVFSQGAERIFEVEHSLQGTNENPEDTRRFMADPAYYADGKRFTKTPAAKAPEKKFGYSFDGKTYTDRAGHTMQVDNEKNFSDAVELEAFMSRFAVEIAEIMPRGTGREAFAKKAMNILSASGRNPITSNTDDVRIALRAAAASSEKFNDALRYVANVETFGSFKKAIEVALA